MTHDTKARRMLACAFFLCCLPGCISVPRSPSPKLYELQPAAGEAIEAGNLANEIIGIGPITLPGYFNRPQIVTKKSDGTIEFAEFNRWAAPLDDEMARVIALNLSTLLPQVNVEIFPWHSALPLRYQVIAEVIQLECRPDAEVTLAMQWSVLDARTKGVLVTRRSVFREPAQGSGYPALVRALSAACASASREFARTLAELAK